MTGLDFSSASLQQAESLAASTGAPIRLVQSGVCEALDVLPAAGFDLVYTGIGALCWLQDIRRWGQVVSTLLRPGGRLFVREGPSIAWSLDDEGTDVLALRYPYSERVDPTVFDSPESYVSTDNEFVHTTSADWNHGLGETVTTVLDAGLRLTGLTEHASVPWEALPGQMEQHADGKYRLREHRNALR